jgi:hypothetical protein
MSLFTNTQTGPRINPLGDTINLIISSEKRLANLQNRSDKIDKDIVIRNNDQEEKEQKINERLDEVKEEIEEIKKEVAKINQNIKVTINFIRHLGHISDLKRLNEKIKDMKFDDMAKMDDVKEIIKDILIEKGKA